MSLKNARSRRAAAYFAESYNCAQSVLLTMCEHWGIKSELVPKIATAFGAGIGRCGSVCGALAGGVMAIGVKYGSNEPSAEERQKAYELGRKLYERFEKQHGTVMCRKLIKCDLRKPEQLEKAREANVFEEICTGFVKDVVGALLDLEKH